MVYCKCRVWVHIAEGGILTLPAFERIFDPARLLKSSKQSADSLPPASETVGNLARVAWPSILESFFVSLVSMVDTIMVGTLGHEAIASVGLTSQPRLIVLALFMSLNIGVTAVVSRRRGEGNRASANHTLRQALLLASILAIVISAVAVYFAEPLLLFAGAQPDALEGAVSYFRIIIGGIFFNIISLTINAAHKGCGNTRIAMRTNIYANLINILFNYLLIGGNLGFPKLGVAGAAIATTLGYFVAFLISLSSVRKPERFLYLSFRESFLPDKQNFSSLMNVGSSAAVEQVFIRIGFFIFAKIIASLGTLAFSTHQICTNILNLSFAFGDGLGVAASSLVGQSLGRKRPDLAIVYGKTAQRAGFMIGACLCVFFIAMRRILILPFSQETGIINMGAQILLILSVMCPAQISQVIFSNCLRVAGDTRYVAVVSLICIGLGRTVVAYFFTITLAWGLLGAWFSFLLDQACRLTLSGLRFSKGRWTKLRL